MGPRPGHVGGVSSMSYVKLQLDYGTDGLPVELPGDRTTVIEPALVPPVPDPTASLVQALRSPIGKPPLREVIRSGQTIAISVCDITRAQPRQVMIEALLSEIPSVRLRDVTILIATGTHRRNTEEEIERMIGRELASGCRIICHDARDTASLIHVGD